jgi:hypothetical protein
MVSLTSDTDLSAMAGDPAVRLVETPSGRVRTALLERVNRPTSFAGTIVGTTCASLRFVRGAPSFVIASPPYDGDFSPAVEGLEGLSADALEGQTYGVQVFSSGSSGSVTVRCLAVTLEF